MINFTLRLLTFCLFLTFIQCKPGDNGTSSVEATPRTDSVRFKKYVPEPGDVPVDPEADDNAFRPQLPLDQAGFKSAKPDEARRLENEFEFMFDKEWRINGRIYVNDDKVHRKGQEDFRFNRDGSYSGVVEGKEISGTWMGRLENNAPVITVFPTDLKEKVNEWFVKNTGKTMVWSGTPSYKDNGVMIQFVLKK
ncbi:MAG TPA: hypothetical protein PLR24_03450 [Saprospiraceae bacterium]|nr:hypothetical protein [Candidatus Parvibacillus calidus]MCC7150102.1 hypothetical protein [Saprospiraceae bacterium]HQN56263.1 hypothetical protein [Saprospiraceae bacterium]